MTIDVNDVARMDFSELEPMEPLSLPSAGKILKEEFMDPLGLSARGLARAMGVPANRITGIINGDRAITAETAVLLGRHFGNSARFWMNLQVSYDLDLAERALAAA